MIKYQVCLNQGVEAFGTGKTITANEVVETADNKFVAHHIHLHNQLIPEQVAQAVLDNFCAVAAELIGQGYALQLKNGDSVMLRLYPDVHLQGDNINLERAKELMPEVTELTLENAGELASRVGVTVRVRAQVTAGFSDLMNREKGGVERVAVKEIAYVAKKDGGNGEATAPATGGNGGNGGDDPNGGND